MSTKFGLHVASGSHNGYGDVVAAAPAVVLAVGEGGALVEAREKSVAAPGAAPRTITIFRDQTVFHDAPPGIDQMSEAQARAAADQYWPQLKEKYRLNPADYYQVTNEYGGDNPTSLANLVAFETRLMELAERDGFKLAVGSPAGGSPGSWELWVRFYVPLIRRAGEGGHIYSRHAYGGVVHPDGIATLTAPDGQAADDNAGRPFREAAYLRAQGIRTPIVITEAGQNGGFRFPGVDTFMEDMARYDRLCRQHENIWGFCAWTYGKYLDFPANIEPASSRMADYLRQQGGATRPVYPTVAGGVTPPAPEPAVTTESPSAPTSTGFRFTHWPTEYRRINQAYNNDPAYYGQWGLTGHEGLDIQAPLNSRIFACAPGRVELVRREAEGHPYGNAVYMRHDDGYRTTYAHLQQVNVAAGDQVAGGQLLGLAGSTGNSRGAHLHLTLYKDGATARGETRQPRDIIDPTPFVNALRAAEWAPPQPPLLNGWGFATSIERAGELGRVKEGININLRAQPSQQAGKLGAVPAGTVVRVTGNAQNDYLPIQVAEAAVTERAGAAPGTHAYEFISFENSAGDYTNVQPGRQFTASWVVRNSGGLPWSGDFQLAYSDEPVAQTANQARSRLGAPASSTFRQLSGREQIAPGESLTFQLKLTAPLQPGWYASHWQLRTAGGEVIGRPLWLHINVAGAVDPIVIGPAAPFQAGMNINPDVHPPDVDRLRGLSWVRFPYKASAKHRNVDQAFNDEYRALIQAYANAGIKSLLILNQETEWGNAPWHNGDWPGYAGSLARAARRIAELAAPFGDKVAYQIWNEGDSDPTNPSAIGVSPENFAPVLQQTAAAIRAVDPDATIVFGGLNTGPENAVAYARRVRDLLGGRLPVDALAYHPYGRYVEFDPFYGKQFGRLDDALRVFKQAFPDLPLWITELGIANDTPIGPEHYEKIARYMREVVSAIADRHAKNVPVLIWFAWSDHMRNAGISTTSGELKPHIKEAFQALVNAGKAAPAFADMRFAAGRPQPMAEFVSFSTTLTDHNAVPAGSTFANTWRFRNTGGTTWDEGYKLVYAPQGATSHPMMNEKSFSLAKVASPLPAAPGDEVAINLSLTAPEQHGRVYRSPWQIRDAAGKAFAHLYAEITVIPASTEGSGARQADMRFIADHTIPDDTPLPEGQTFLKQWRVQNTGARHWGSGFRLVFVEGDLQMAAGIASHMVPESKPGDEVILSVPMVAPVAQEKRATTYSSLWRLQDDRGNFFGAPIWARIISQPGEMVTPLGRFADMSGWYSQHDPRWANERLGHGQQTIGAWGCLLTCYAMMLTAYGLRVTPADVNRRFQQLGDQGFRGSDVQFIAPTHLLAGLTLGRNLRSWPTPELPFTEWTGEDPIARIDRAIADGFTVLAQVDRRPNDAFYHSNTEQHWVILVTRTPDGSDYLMLDSITPPGQLQNQPLSLMRKYGSPAPSRSHEDNLRHAIKSALIYLFSGQPGSG
ncbi:MAG: peptidoglycan DD-metalloendopeptidase family protein [Chloroflexi bacterium]|nr:peptidoglycan DD-metalloendopeptidase family protein [Chloroflexota bacterium]